MSLLNTLLTDADDDVSFEATEITVDENEVEIYIRGLDIDAIKHLFISSEYQLQYSFFSEKTPEKTAPSSHRVRMSIVSQNGEEPVTSYQRTFKIMLPDGTRPEGNADITREEFELFMLGCDSSMEKTRNVIPAGLEDYPGVMFQIDVFKGSEWVKVDLELPVGVSLPRAVVVTAVIDTLGEGEEVIYVFPKDKVDKTEDALRAHAIMRKEGTTKGPFTKESA